LEADADPFLADLRAQIESGKGQIMTDRSAFAAWLDELLTAVAEEAKRRNFERLPRVERR
jgi:hypothetical protein